MVKGILGSNEVRWKWAVWNGVGAQGEGAWQRDTEGGETRMGNGWTGGRWSDLEGGTWLRESWGAKKCDGNGWWGMGVGAQGEGHGGVHGCAV